MRSKLKLEGGATSIILPKSSHYIKRGIPLAKDAAFADPELLAGTIMAYDTANKKWVPYVNAGPNGTGTARGILAEGILKAKYTTEDMESIMYVHGMFNPNDCADNLNAIAMGQLTGIIWTVDLV